MPNRYSLSLALAALILTPSTVNAACEPELLAAMRTTYGLSQNTDLSEAAQQVTCHSDQSTSSAGISYTGVYGILGLDGQSQDIATACVQNNKAFFQRNATQIAYSYVPKEVIAACSTGLYMTATQKSDEDLVQVRIVYVPPENRFAEVKKITVTPRDALDCGETVPNRGTEINREGLVILCQRKNDGAVGIKLTTNFSTEKSITLARKQKVEFKPIIWDHFVRGDSWSLLCVDKTDPNNWIPVGNVVHCGSVGVCQLSEQQSGYCASTYGNQAIFIDDRRAGMIKQ